MRANNDTSPVLERYFEWEIPSAHRQTDGHSLSAEKFIQSDKEALARLLKLALVHQPGQANSTNLETNQEISRIIPVVCSYFSRSELVYLLGEEMTRQLLDMYHIEVLQNLFLERELQRMLQAFNEAQIPILLMKGAALAYTVYAEPGLRTYHDIDALIHPADLPRAHELLTGMGFVFFEEYRANSLNKKRTGYNYSLEQTDSWLEVLIELHTAPHPSDIGSAFDVEALWAKAQPVTILGEPTFTMSPADHLLYLCWHYRFHGFSRLIWLYDIVVMLRAKGSELDWAELVRAARRLRQATSLYYCLSWCRDLFGAAIPEEVFSELYPAFVCRIAIEHIILPDPAEALILARFQSSRILAYRAMADTTLALLLACLRAFIPEPSVLAMRYMEHSRLPLRLYFLFYLLHPWITLAKGLRYLFGRRRK